MNGPFLILRAMLSALRLAMLNDHRVGALVVARLQTLGQLAPRRAGVTTTARAAFTTTHRMVNRVHGDATVVRTAPEPTGATRLAQADVLVFEIRDLTDGRAAQHVDLANLAAGQLDLRVGGI